MDKDLHNFWPAHMKLKEDMEHLSATLKPSYLNVYEQMERVLEPIRWQHLELARSIEHSSIAPSRLSEILQANQHWQELIDQTTASTRVFEDLKGMHQTWLDKTNPLQDTIAHIQATTKLSLGDVIYRLTITEQLFAG